MYNIVFSSIKIMLLIFIFIFSVELLKTLLTIEKTKLALKGKGRIAGGLLATTLGIVTPFSAYSVVPIIIEFKKAEIPTGIIFTFLICAPLTNEAVSLILLGVWGFKATLAYIAFGSVISFVSGFFIDLNKFNLSSKTLISEFNIPYNSNKKPEFYNLKSKINYAYKSALKIISKLWCYIVIGITLATIFKYYLHEDYISGLICKNNPFAVPIAILLGIPIYLNVAAVFPIAKLLVAQGIPLGTIIAFAMSSSSVSISDMLIIGRVIKLKLLIIFISIFISACMLIGYTINFIS
ncbi:MAG: permease [bacterium]